jgi:hypothetical protein
MRPAFEVPAPRPGAAARSRLTVSRPGDAGEREADRVADRVLRMPEPARRGGPRELPVPAAGPAPTGGGRPLPAGVRAFFEPRFGHDLGDVRVHADDRAARSARALDAAAYTVGRDVVFAPGQYRPDAEQGRRLLAHELAHVLHQTDSPHRLERQAASPSLRSPTLEISALRGQGGFAVHSSPLTSPERSAAATVFGGSIDLSKVRIVVSPVIAAPVTLGNTIRVPPATTMPRHILIHELAHVWQFQTKGAAYISDSVFHQTAAFLTRGDRGAAYGYTIVPGQGIDRYTAEQQAMIIEDYFIYPQLRSDPAYQRLLAEVRSRRPISAPPAFFEELAAGLGSRGTEPPPLPGQRPGEPPNVPILEFRF